jgi:glucan phosphoethanolaminetransferase (alkaline phosphatase superfamily)
MVYRQLKQPAYLHVLLNPLPIYGLATGVIALAVALLLRSRPARVVALAVVALSALSAWLAFYFGQKAYMPVFMSLEPDAQQWLDVHMLRAERWIYAFYLTAALAVAGMVADGKFPAAARPLAITTLVVAVAATLIGGWIGHAGGQVRHSEFREGPPARLTKPHKHAH